MECDFEEFEPPNEHGQRRLRCRRADCRFTTGYQPYPPSGIHCDCRSRTAIAGSPGNALRGLIEELGLTKKENCRCEAMRQQMNNWGVDGCRHHRAEIIDHLNE